MAASNWIFYNTGREYIGDGTIDLDTHTFKVALLNATYTPSVTTHTVFADLTNEVSDGGYTAGGSTLSTVTWGDGATAAIKKFTGTHPQLTATTSIVAAYAVLYDDTPTSPADPLICYMELEAGGTNVTVSASGTLDITMDATGGIFNISGATS